MRRKLLSGLRGALLGAFALILLALPYTTAAQSGCGCDSTATFHGAYDRANVVFVGTCMDVLPNALKGGLNVLFQIDSSWKRGIEPVTTVHTNSPNQCGWDFRRGERYIVFAGKRHQTISTSVCEPNQVWNEAGLRSLSQLGPAFRPGREELASNMNWLLVGLAGAGMAFLAFVVLRKKISGAKS